MSTGSGPGSAVRADRRRVVRLIAAALSVGCAIVYFAIGLGLIHPVEATDATGDLFVFGAASGLAFLLGAALLVGTDRRPVWVFGAIFQVLVIVMYFVVAEKRTLAFEGWGLALKVAQLAILAAFAYLAATPVDGSRSVPRTSPTTPPTTRQ